MGVPMALMDFVPVLMFLATWVLLLWGAVLLHRGGLSTAESLTA